MNKDNAVIKKGFSKEVALPQEVAERYKKYCEITKMKSAEYLRVLILDATPLLHNAEKLDFIIDKTQNREFPGAYQKIHVRLPGETLAEIDTYCKFFKLTWKRCHFMYFMIEEKLLQMIEDVLTNE